VAKSPSQKRRLQRPFHAAADARERRLAKALQKSLSGLANEISINELAAAIGARDVRKAVMVGERGFEGPKDPLGPPAAISRDAFVKGGKIGAAMVEGDW
jgi:hypothetical protein